MNYLKITQLANLCEVKQGEVNVLYRLIGGNNLTEDVKILVKNQIEDINKEIIILENKLKKEIS